MRAQTGGTKPTPREPSFPEAHVSANIPTATHVLVLTAPSRIVASTVVEGACQHH